MHDEMDNVEWLRKSSSDELCGSALNKCADEIERLREVVERLKSEESCNDVLLEYAQAENERLRKKNARLQEMLEPFAKAYNDTIAAASLAPRFVKKGHEIFFEEEPYRAGCGLTEMYDVSNENRSLTFKNVVLSQEITRLREETARLREALKPFADRLDELEKSPLTKYACATSVEIAHLRAARAAIREGGT